MDRIPEGDVSTSPLTATRGCGEFFLKKKITAGGSALELVFG